jgi:hypothetical protein
MAAATHLVTPVEAGKDFRLTSFDKNSSGADADIRSVELVGSAERVTWSHDSAGLTIVSPAKTPDELAVVYRIRRR